MPESLSILHDDPEPEVVRVSEWDYQAMWVLTHLCQQEKSTLPDSRHFPVAVWIAPDSPPWSVPAAGSGWFRLRSAGDCDGGRILRKVTLASELPETIPAMVFPSTLPMRFRRVRRR